MSRHRVKNLDVDVDDELDDFDGGYEDDSEMQEALAKAKATLGGSFTDKEIQDSLWHYYYDVDKTVNYLLSEIISSRLPWLLRLTGSQTKGATKGRKTRRTHQRRLKVGFFYLDAFCELFSAFVYFPRCWLRYDPRRD